METIRCQLAFAMRSWANYRDWEKLSRANIAIDNAASDQTCNVASPEDLHIDVD